MKKSTLISIILLSSMFILPAGHQVLADDSCVFMVSSEDLPPNIVILLDNGAAMEQVMWHASFNNNEDYTPEPDVALQTDVVVNGTGDGFYNGQGAGFYNENGYSIFITGGKYYIVDIPENLDVADHNYRLMADGDGKSPVWTISFGPVENDKRTVTLPASPSTVVDAGVIDNAEHFRFAKNYLNWIFFSGEYEENGSEFENRSRFYYAKKAILDVAKLTANQAKFGIYNFTSNSSGASNVAPLGLVVDTPLAIDPENNNLDPNFVNVINNMGTVDYSPLAEGLASVGGYYASPSSGILYCEKNFVIVASPGMSSEDLSAAAGSSPANIGDFDEEYKIASISEGEIMEIIDGGETKIENTNIIPININGSTYLDDVAYYLYSNDIVEYHYGFQNVMTYTIGFMGNHLSNLFLINTSNNGNGNVNLYDTSHEEYGDYHKTADNPATLATTILATVDDILSITSTFVAPVVPVTRTTSGNQMYMAFFTPSENNLWEGNVLKFGIDEDNVIIDKNDNPATHANGALRNDAVPIWQTKDWSVDDPLSDPFNASRNIYTYIGISKDLAHSSNAFKDDNKYIALEVLGNPTHTKEEIINYVRGADVFDEDGDNSTTDTRSVIIGDVLHSEPLVINYSFPGDKSMTMVYFGSNDGMLHAVLDIDDNGDTRGEEAWGFIPPNHLHRLKYLVEGLSHQYYIDSSPKSYFHDLNGDGIVNSIAGDKVILVCGERKGGTSYFALDVTAPLSPKFLWRIDQSDSEAGVIGFSSIETSPAGGSFQVGNPLRIYNDGEWGPEINARVNGTMIDNVLPFDNATGPFEIGQVVGNLTTAQWQDYSTHVDSYSIPFIIGQINAISTYNPDYTVPQLGESWSEPQFGLVKTSDGESDEGTPVIFLGGGYSSDNSTGNAVIVLDVFTGEPLKIFTSLTGMDYSIPSSIAVIDEDGNGFVDKIYVGDLGGQLWRFGKFTDSLGNSLGFPNCDENINNWTGQRLFTSDPAYQRKFFYPPSLTLEKGYDLVYFGTGDREDPCNDQTSDGFYCIKDNHNAGTLSESDLVDVTDPLAAAPDLDSETSDVDLNYVVDKGWYIQLATGEKVLAENTIFYKTAYFTTFVPNGDPCYPGGTGKIYALEYKTAGAVLDFDNDGDADRSLEIGGGIPSKIVPVITDTGGVDLFISVGSTIPMIGVDEFDAGIVRVDPLVPPLNFFYLWWRELIQF